MCSKKQKLAYNMLKQIESAILRIMQRTQEVSCADDFLLSPFGMEKLDSVCMLLIAIGEGLKNIDKQTEGKLLPLYPSVPWRDIKGMRDIIAHHYFDIDADEVYNIVSQELQPLLEGIRFLIQYLEKDVRM